jgi:hypothetical protein
MPPLRFLFFLSLALLVVRPVEAQSVFSLQRAQSSLISTPLKGDAVFFYETTHHVKDQMGEWNFLLKERERASINILNEEGNYQEIILFMNDDDDVFSYLKFSYQENGQLQQIEEKNQLFGIILLLNYTFDKRGRPSTLICTNNGEPHTEMTFTAKGRSQLSEKLVVNRNNIQVLTEYLDGLPQQREVYDTSNALVSREVFSYNKQGLIGKIESTFTASTKGNGVSIFTYRYDDRGNWTHRLEHNQATGNYTLVQRDIVYSDQVPPSQELPVGHWNCLINNLVLDVNEDGSFSLIDNQERDVLRGKWSSLGWGRYQFNVRHQDHFGSRRPFRSNQGLTVELRDGRLIMYDKDHHFDFMAEQIKPTHEVIKVAQAHTIWEASLWESPGKRRDDVVPADIKAAFDNAYPVAPNVFRVFLDSLCGIVDGTGTVLFPFAYEYVTLAGTDKYLIKKDGKTGLVDQYGGEILPPVYDRIWFEFKIGPTILGTRKNGKRYYYDLDKGDFLPYEKDDIMGLNDNRMIVRKDRSWLLTDRDFHPITEESTYYSIKALSADRYLASEQGQYVILDANGNQLAALPGFRNIRMTIFGYLEAQAEENRLYALLDQNGKQLTPPIYEQLTFCRNEKEPSELYYELRNHNAIAKYSKPNGEEGYVTGLGEEVRSRN